MDLDFSGCILTRQAKPARIEYINAAITDCTMTAYSGQGQVVVDTAEIPGKIVVKGVHDLQPAPADRGAASAGRVDLSRTLPDPCTPGHAVYFTGNPNKLMKFTDPAPCRS